MLKLVIVIFFKIFVIWFVYGFRNFWCFLFIFIWEFIDCNLDEGWVKLLKIKKKKNRLDYKNFKIKINKMYIDLIIV